MVKLTPAMNHVTNAPYKMFNMSEPTPTAPPSTDRLDH